MSEPVSETLLIAVSLIFLVASLAVLYPFRPFRTRKRAALVMAASFALVLVSAPREPATELADAAGAAPAPASAAAGQAAAPSEAAARLSEEAVAAAGAGQWGVARNRLDAVQRLGVATDDLTARMVEAALAHIRPLPASDAEANRAGYAFLAVLQPDEPAHAAARDRYAETIRAEEEARRAALMERLRRHHDRIGGVTWITHVDAPRHTDSRSTVHLYMGQRDGNPRPWLRMKVQYAADRWLFVERVEAWHDGVREPLIGGRFERDHNHRIWEWLDVTPDARQIEVLHSLAHAREAVLRFHGRQYVRDVTLSAADKRALREMLAAHSALAGL